MLVTCSAPLPHCFSCSLPIIWLTSVLHAIATMSSATYVTPGRVPAGRGGGLCDPVRGLHGAGDGDQVHDGRHAAARVPAGREHEQLQRHRSGRGARAHHPHRCPVRPPQGAEPCARSACCSSGGATSAWGVVNWPRGLLPRPGEGWSRVANRYRAVHRLAASVLPMSSLALGLQLVGC